ncbi:MAG: type II toxin-antitoxin system Phd/YefM family antitoxin [Defluviitaleaceae bacterium]|nr:type II toxin-antitoxin system Phd/YefM family antitoxin [Defluviitaleaceae bacterium]
MIAIKTSDLTQDFKRYANKVMQGETVLISRPRNENLVVISEQLYNELSRYKKPRYNAETEAAIKEARGIMSGKIHAKEYHTLGEFYSDLDSEEDDDI